MSYVKALSFMWSFLSTITRTHNRVWCLLLAILYLGASCSTEDHKILGNGELRSKRQLISSSNKPNQPPPPSKPLPTVSGSASLEHGSLQITSRSLKRPIAGSSDSKLRQAYEKARQLASDPTHEIPRLANLSTNIIIGVAVNSKRTNPGSGMAVRNETTVNVTETLKGAKKNSLTVTWTETSESHPLYLNTTYLLFLISNGRQTWCIAEQNAALKVASSKVHFRDKIIGLSEAKQLVSGR